MDAGRQCGRLTIPFAPTSISGGQTGDVDPRHSQARLRARQLSHLLWVLKATRNDEELIVRPCELSAVVRVRTKSNDGQRRTDGGISVSQQLQHAGPTLEVLASIRVVCIEAAGLGFLRRREAKGSAEPPGIAFGCPGPGNVFERRRRRRHDTG